MRDCAHCKYAQWDWDDAYGAMIRWVEGCERETGCIYEDEDDV